MQHESSHSSPGFGKNTNGFGIVIIAVVLVAFAIIMWALWNDGSTEASWYRLEKTEAAAHGEAHEPAEKVEIPAAMDSTEKATISDTAVVEKPATDSSAKH